MREPFDRFVRDFENSHPGVHVEMIEMDDDVYSQMGLVTLFVGGTPPDVYFQWGGYQVRRWASAGYALDLTDQFQGAEKDRFLPSTWPSTLGSDGKNYLWPNSASVTTVMWFQKGPEWKRVAKDGGVPETWTEFLELCERIRAGGQIPIAVGNKELWGGGNFVAAVLAQALGGVRYDEVLGLKPGTRLDDSDVVQAMERVAELGARGFLNEGVAGVGTDEARALFLQRRAALHPIGDWLVTDADESQAGRLDAFPIPRISSDAGSRSTLLGLSTGYMVYSRTAHRTLALDFLRRMTSDAVQKSFVAAGHVSAVAAAEPDRAAPAGQHRMLEFLKTADETVLAPDVGYHLEVSDAFLDAASEVLSGRRGARAAMSAADRQVQALRRPRP